jgi:hypothetical protein
VLVASSTASSDVFVIITLLTAMCCSVDDVCSYDLNVAKDLWPVVSWITLSGMLLWNRAVAPVAHEELLVFLGMPASWPEQPYHQVCFCPLEHYHTMVYLVSRGLFLWAGSIKHPVRKHMVEDDWSTNPIYN